MKKNPQIQAKKTQEGQTAQRCSACHIPGDFEDLAGPGTEHLMELCMSLFTAGELEQVTFKGPFQVYDSMTS